jgi:hypothetical protein
MRALRFIDSSYAVFCKTVHTNIRQRVAYILRRWYLAATERSAR